MELWQYVLKNHGKSGQTTAPGKGEYIFRYLTCLICVLVISWIMLSLAGNDDNTILRKLIESREYAVKVLCAEICIMLLYAIAELFVEEAKDGKHEKIRSVLYSFNDSKVWSVFRKYIGPVVVAALAILVVCLNFSMMSDRVVWGDEAFSANTATTLIVQASIWKFIIDTDYGTLNTLLMKLGIIDHAVNWTPTAGAYFAWEIACGIFVTIPFVTFTVLSGLQSIDASYYEAAAVDGASYWQKMFQITIPLVRPNLTISTILNIIYVFNSFPISN